MPEPLPPTTTSGATSEELAFFDRVKKYIGNKSTMNEFLKLCNLFSQDLIDRNVLVHKVSNFIGGNPDLMNWFKAFVNYDGEDEVIENKPKPPTGKVSLSNCRGLGPSYRLLPKRVRPTILSLILSRFLLFVDGLENITHEVPSAVLTMCAVFCFLHLLYMKAPHILAFTDLPSSP